MICGSQPHSETNLRPNSHPVRARTISLNTNSKYTKVFNFLFFAKEVLIEPNLLDTAHGFAARPDLELPEVKTAFAGALVQTVDWFKKTL